MTDFRSVRRITHVVIATFLVVTTASAHHILGVPHYAYSEDYPQTPILTYSADLGPHHLRMTGNPGKPEPSEQCSLHIYISNRETERPFDGIVTVTVFQDAWIGTGEIVYGPMKASIEEAMYKYTPVFPEEANYTVRIEYSEQGVPWIIDLPMVAGEPGSPGRVLAISGAALAAFLIVVRAIRIKRARRETEMSGGSPATQTAESVATQ